MIVRFYTTPSGASPVEKYLDKLGGVEAEKVLAAILDIATNGLQGTTVSLRQIDGKLWEMRVSKQRVFYVVIDGPQLILLHAYKKQGQKAPRHEIATATKRMNEVLGGVER